MTGVEAIDNKIPAEYSLSQNYPNPFNPTTKINFSLPEAGNYTLKVFDILGREVALLHSGELTAGTHQAVFDASRLSSGVYFYSLTGDNVHLVKKMLLLK